MLHSLSQNANQKASRCVFFTPEKHFEAFEITTTSDRLNRAFSQSELVLLSILQNIGKEEKGKVFVEEVDEHGP